MEMFQKGQTPKKRALSNYVRLSPHSGHSALQLAYWLWADSVAKIGRKDPRRNVRSGTRAALNLPCHVNAADDSMFRVS
jgi:hypothetical protein